MDEQIRQKIAETIRRRWQKREKYGLKGRPISQEQKIKLRDTIKSRWANHQYDSLIGSKLSSEIKKKISDAITKKWQQTDYRTKNVAALEQYWGDEVKRVDYSEKAKLRWKDPVCCANMLAGIQKNANLPTYKEIMRQHGIRRANEISKMFKILWQNQEWRVRQVLNNKIVARRLEVREKKSANGKKLWENSEYRDAGIERLAQQRKSIKFQEALRAIMATESYRRKISANSKKLWENSEYRNKITMAVKQRWQNIGFRNKMSTVRLAQPRTSSQQLILYSLLDDLKIKYYKDSDEQCRIGYYCFDCRIDPQEVITLKKPLLIEVQGDYWHSLDKNVQNDKSKATYLRTYFPEFDLKYLWEHEFDNKDRIIGLLKYWLGLDNFELKLIDFNQIERRIIDFKEAELFISKYHYAGRVGRSGVNLGYYLDGQLIAVIIYSNPVRQEVAIKQGYLYKEVLELSRLAIHPEYQVKNLASHLISRSVNYIRENRQEIKCLISFADSTYNHLGTIYKASNWVLDGETSPDYWYADDKGYICHKKTLWNKAKKFGITESEYCLKYNYMKVWGEKKFRYIYRLSNSDPNIL